jgi:hypothetical protein
MCTSDKIQKISKNVYIFRLLCSILAHVLKSDKIFIVF